MRAGEVGHVTFKGTIREEAANIGRITNEGLMVADEAEIPSNEVITLVVEDVAVAITKVVDRGIAVPDDVLEYDLLVSNIGPSPLTQIVITDAVPDELDYLPISVEPPDERAPDYDATTRTLTWQIGIIEPGEQVPLAFTAQVRDDVRSGTLVTNTATVTTHETQPMVSNQANTLIQYPDLTITKSPDRASVVVGSELTYTVLVANLADGPTDSTWVHDVLPGGFDYVGSSTTLESWTGDDWELVSTDDPREGSDVSEGLIWSMGRLGAYAEMRLKYRTLITGDAGPGFHDNRAMACGVTPLADSLCTDPAIATVEVVVPALTITKTTAERSVDYGDLIIYDIRVQNNTVAPVEDLTIRDHLPIGFGILPGSSVINGESTIRSSGPTGCPRVRSVERWIPTRVATSPFGSWVA